MTILQLLRLFLVASALGALTLIALRPRAVWRVVGGFLGQRSYAITLGAIRIFLFTRLYMATSAIKVGPLTEAPANTRNLPPGWGWLGDIVPLFDLGFAKGVYGLFIVTVLLAILGAGTRFTAPIAAFASAYLLGLPNFFAKINHGEHLLVCFCIILAFSRCADACSVDELVRGARQRRWSLSRYSGRSLAYGLPIRMCWIVLGLAYFFPGLYKTWNAGDQWLKGTALLVIAYQKLASLTEYRPLIVIYDSPKLLAFLGAATLAFELGWIFAILSRRFWWIAVVIALSFHVGLAFSIGIVPWSIVKVFWIFLDVGAILYLFRHRIPKRVLDLLGITEDPPAAETATVEPTTAEPAKAEPAKAAAAKADSADEEPSGEAEHEEADSAKTEATPDSAQEHAPDSAKKAAKAPSIAAASKQPFSKAAPPMGAPRWSTSATAGGAVIGLMLFTGLAGIDTFPVAVFPRFDTRRGPTKDLRPSRYVLAIQRPGVEPQDVTQDQIPKNARRARWDKALGNLAHAKGEARDTQYKVIASVLENGGARFKPGDRLVLYKEFIRFDPETHNRVVEERKVLSKYDVKR